MKKSLKAALLATAVSTVPACGDDDPECFILSQDPDAQYFTTPEAVRAHCDLDDVMSGVKDDLFTCVDLNHDDQQTIQFRCGQESLLNEVTSRGRVECVTGNGTSSCY